MNYENEKNSLNRLRQNQIEKLKKAKANYDEFYNSTNDKDLETNKKLSSLFHILNIRSNSLTSTEKKLEFIRQPNEEDILYRRRQYREFCSRLKEVTKEDDTLCYHGCPIYAARSIISDKELSSSADRLGYSTSYDVSDQVSVTTKDSIDVTVNSYCDLLNYNMPCGCIFVLYPKDENEINTSRTSMLIGNVNLKDDPNRLYAIITSKENIEIVRKWLEEANLDSSIVYDFDSYIEMLSKKRTK